MHDHSLELPRAAAVPVAPSAPPAHSRSATDATETIGRRTAQGAVVTTATQAAAFALRMGSMVVLARLILPRDFGLVGMVTAFTGFLSLLRDGGLSMAAVQRSTITEEQTSTLFWINLAVGIILAMLCALAGPFLVRFYDEPRLFAIAVVIGFGFVFNGAGIQQRALLQRSLRFTALAAIDTVSLVVSLAIGIGAAAAGARYWAIVLMTIGLPAAGAIGAWLSTRWIPGPPRRGTGVRSLLWYGGTVTLNNIIVYIAYNTDKVLLGRFWGAEMLGIYGRAYQLINIPTDNLNFSIGLVAFPALSRVQHDSARMRDYFLQGYGFFQSLVMPLTAACLLFAADIIGVFLGPKWSAAAPIFRLLAPTVLAFALVNPLTWVVLATGHAMRSLHIALFITPVVVAGYSFGLSSGPQGVALGFSTAMMLLVAPIMVWATRGTSISLRDIAETTLPSLLSIITASAVAYGLRPVINPLEPALLRLIVETGILFAIYVLMLLWGFGQQPKYVALLERSGFWPLRRRVDASA